jgi:hypothetical protein
MEVMKNRKHSKWLGALALGLLINAASAQAAVSQAYGAIAYSPSDKAIGISQRAVNQEAAEQEAMGRCAVIAGGDNCRIAVWFYNACAALAVAPNGAWGADFGLTTSGELMKGINAAFQKAKARCQSFGGDGCQLEQATCSFDTAQ